ncbi:hypothetical protein LZD49_05380 [Dyadobacter sp. CY261]|uniref:hypothetical protein n=1 Tax=Dyadobacter sp. CY261 TaxID=2907203 RepID=UPI001F4796DD|nr:hypothetical protein [Dyadobacter sp. CY261]MCF0069893.1 hypothetical protein [Dyadobacter sp. CY261]
MRTRFYLLVMLATLGFSGAMASNSEHGKQVATDPTIAYMPALSESGTINLAKSITKKAALLLDPPVITNPGLTLFYAPSNMWQFTQIPGGTGTTYNFYVTSGSATLVPNGGDCYITTVDGATVCVAGTNAAGTGTPYCFYVPGM